MADDEATCTLCYEDYSETEPDNIPRSLTCGHTYCTGTYHKLRIPTCADPACMRNLKDNEPEEDDFAFGRIDRHVNTITCPGCKKQTSVPNGKVENIPKNFAYIQLLERVKELEGKKKTSKTFMCSEHSDEQLRYWCFEKTCNKAVCSSCLLEGIHRRHEYKPLSIVCKSQRQDLQERLTLAQEQTAVIQKGFEKIVEEIEKLTILGDSTKRKIQAKFEEMHQTLKTRENVLLESIQEYTEENNYILDSQKQCVEQALENAKKVCEEAKGVVEGHDLDVLKKHREAMDCLADLAANLPEVPLETLVKVHIRFGSQPAGLLKDLEKYGKLLFEEPQQPKVESKSSQKLSPSTTARSPPIAQGGTPPRVLQQRVSPSHREYELLSAEEQETLPPLMRGRENPPECTGGHESPLLRAGGRDSPPLPRPMQKSISSSSSYGSVKVSNTTQGDLYHTVSSPPPGKAGKLSISPVRVGRKDHNLESLTRSPLSQITSSDGEELTMLSIRRKEPNTASVIQLRSKIPPTPSNVGRDANEPLDVRHGQELRKVEAYSGLDSGFDLKSDSRVKKCSNDQHFTPSDPEMRDIGDIRESPEPIWVAATKNYYGHSSWKNTDSSTLGASSRDDSEPEEEV